MADLTALEAELRATQLEIELARKAKMEAFIAQRKAEEEAAAAAEAAKTPEQKAAELQAKIDEHKARLAQLKAE